MIDIMDWHYKTESNHTQSVNFILIVFDSVKTQLKVSKSLYDNLAN